MMRVPEGQVAITINDGMTGERHVKVCAPGTSVADVLEELGVTTNLDKITLRLRNGTDVNNIDRLDGLVSDGDVLTISPSKQGAGA
jgi:hypothetical protein